MQVYVMVDSLGIVINADVNGKNCFMKVDVMIDLQVDVKVINHVILENIYNIWIVNAENDWLIN